MVITRRKDRRKGDAKTINIEGERDKEKEIVIHHKIVPPGKERSTWSWHEEFALEWSETFITKKRKRNPKKGG